MRKGQLIHTKEDRVPICQPRIKLQVGSAYPVLDQLRVFLPANYTDYYLLFGFNTTHPITRMHKERQ